MRKNILNLFLVFFILLSNNVKASNKTLKFELQPRSYYEKSDYRFTDDDFCDALGLFKESKVAKTVINAKHIIISYLVRRVDEGDEDGIEFAEEELKDYDPTFWNMAITLAKKRK